MGKATKSFEYFFANGGQSNYILPFCHEVHLGFIVTVFRSKLFFLSFFLHILIVRNTRITKKEKDRTVWVPSSVM